MADYNEGLPFSWGDAFTLVGNVSGIIATGAILAGASPAVAAVATGVGVLSTAAAIYNGTNFEKLRTWSSDVMTNFWPSSPVPTSTRYLYLDSTGGYQTYDAISNNPNISFGAIEITRDNWGSPASIVPTASYPEPPEPDYWVNPMRATV